MGPGKVEVHEIDYPKLELQDGPGVNPANVGRKCNHGVILKVATTNICGSDQHMVRGRTTAPHDLVLGHEILGEVVEAGPDVEFIEVGDLCSVPFNTACGRCRMCKEGKTGICLNVNPARPGAASGYVDMGGWVGGQAEYVMVPYADWNLLKFPDRDQGMDKVKDLTMLAAAAGAQLLGRWHRHPGLYVTGDPGGVDEAAQTGSLSLSLGTGWARSLYFMTGQCPVMKYNHGLRQAILHDRVQIAKAVNATVVPLDGTPQGYADFDSGVRRRVRHRPARHDRLTPGAAFRRPGRATRTAPGLTGCRRHLRLTPTPSIWIVLPELTTLILSIPDRSADWRGRDRTRCLCVVVAARLRVPSTVDPTETWTVPHVVHLVATTLNRLPATVPLVRDLPRVEVCR